jgi:hypothetical protein
MHDKTGGFWFVLFLSLTMNLEISSSQEIYTETTEICAEYQQNYSFTQPASCASHYSLEESPPTYRIKT